MLDVKPKDTKCHNRLDKMKVVLYDLDDQQASNRSKNMRGFYENHRIQTAEVMGHGYSTYVRVYTDEDLTCTGECIHGGAASSV